MSGLSVRTGGEVSSAGEQAMPENRNKATPAAATKTFSSSRRTGLLDFGIIGLEWFCSS
jgi:hypothetical protein